MSAIAETVQHAVFDDRLARRNAMVLAVAQALAGGNNTVIVSTASIATGWTPDPSDRRRTRTSITVRTRSA